MRGFWAKARLFFHTLVPRLEHVSIHLADGPDEVVGCVCGRVFFARAHAGSQLWIDFSSMAALHMIEVVGRAAAAVVRPPDGDTGPGAWRIG